MYTLVSTYLVCFAIVLLALAFYRLIGVDSPDKMPFQLMVSINTDLTMGFMFLASGFVLRAMNM